MRTRQLDRVDAELAARSARHVADPSALAIPSTTAG
jgi:hypothetical protein